MYSNKIKFAHVRDSLGILRATVAYIIRKDYTPMSIDRVDYGITIVSPSEPLDKISYKIARNKAVARCEQSPINAGWHDYAPRRGITHSHGKQSTYEVIRKVGFQKIGTMDFKEFGNKIKKVKKAVSKL